MHAVKDVAEDARRAARTRDGCLAISKGTRAGHGSNVGSRRVA